MINKKTVVNTRLKTSIAVSAMLVLGACSSSDDDNDAIGTDTDVPVVDGASDIALPDGGPGACPIVGNLIPLELGPCLLYTSDAADE